MLVVQKKNSLSSGREKRRGPQVFLSVAELMDIFPEESPGTLATLSEAYESLPSEILGLVPHITSVQLAEYGELVKEHQAARDFKPKVLDSSEILKAIEREAARHVCFGLDTKKNHLLITLCQQKFLV